MAYTRAALGSERVRPMVGRNGMLDVNFQIVGPSGMRLPIADLTTAATTLGHGGVNRISGLQSTQGPVQYNLPKPSPGEVIEVFSNCTSTGSYQFLSTPNGASIIAATLGTTVGVINIVGPAGRFQLRASSTNQWTVLHKGPYTSTALADAVTHTTST